MTDVALPIPPSSPRSGRAILFRAIKILLLTFVLTAVGYALTTQWRMIDFKALDLHPPLLIAALVAFFCVSIVQLISYRTLLKAYASAPPWRSMPPIAWIPPLGKYLPGAAVPAAVSMLRRFSIPIGAAVTVVLVLDGLAVLAGLITGAPLLLWQPVRQAFPHLWIAAIPILIAGAVCLWPDVFAMFINLVLRRLGREPLAHVPSIAEYSLPLLCAFGQWVFAGLGLMFLIAGVTGSTPWTQLPLLISFAALSQTIGFLTLFAPGGLGPREAILLICLTPMVGPLAAIVVPMRAIAQIAVDLLGALIGFVILRQIAPLAAEPRGA